MPDRATMSAGLRMGVVAVFIFHLGWEARRAYGVSKARNTE